MSFSSFETFLSNLNVHPVLGTNYLQKDFVKLDLSVYNTALKNINISSSKALENYICNYINSRKSKVAYGGYLEQRGIYQRSTYFNQRLPETERNIHLGIDLWLAANSPVYAPLKGEIHSFKNNTNYGDYGPTLILKHTINMHQFYTLYGHLSLDTITDKSVGVKVKQGEKIATLGKATVNGDYPPHLHFQIIKDIQDFIGDYPGVSNKNDLEFYKANCPNPNVLLKL